jgi:hypothetical protein
MVVICVILAGRLSLIGPLRQVGEFIALLPPRAWLWWFALLLWKPVHLAWQSTLHGVRRLSN